MSISKKYFNFKKINKPVMSKLSISVLVLLITCTSISAQFFTKKIKGNGDIITKTRTVNDYNKVAVAGSFDVELFKGKEGTLTIKGDENLMEYIITEVKKGTLKIKTKKGYNISTRKTIVITVPFKNINAVSLAGSGDIHSSDAIESTDLKLSLAGSGSMNVTVSTQKLISSIAGSGSLNLKGDTNEFKCSVAGSGDVNSFDLKSSKVKVSIAGSGNVKVHASNEIHASTAGSGDIYYSGNPSIEKVSSVGSGSIKKKN